MANQTINKITYSETPQSELARRQPKEITKPDQQKQELVKSMETNTKKSNPIIMVVVSIAIVMAGIGSGYGLSKITASSGDSVKTAKEISEQGIQVGDVIGIEGTENFRDKVEGVVVKGGISGEGSHHLLRPGGESQNVYLTSSAVDLDELVDHKVMVWGETFASQQAGWLMDVGRVEVLELNAEKPFEEEE